MEKITKSKEEAFVSDIAGKVFEKVLQETPSKSMTPPPKPFSILWRPNNYRRQIKVSPRNESSIQNIKTALGYSPHPQNKIISIKNYKGITLQYAKSNITGIFSQNIINGVKEIYLIQANSIDALNERISQKKQDIHSLIDNAVMGFIQAFNIKIEGPLKWSRYEDFVKGEEYIDKLPREVIIHDTYFKKVYGQGIEFMGKEEPTVHMKNFIKNRAIESIAPEINNELTIVKEYVKGILEVNAGTSLMLNAGAKSLNEFHKDIRVHNKAIKDLAKGISKFNRLLSERQGRLGEFV